MVVSRRRAEGLGILILVMLVYAGSLDNGFHFDDDHSIVRNTHLHDLSTAIEQMERATSLDSSDAVLWAKRGGLLGSVGQMEKAATMLERALQLGDRRPKTACNRAEILVGLGQRAWDEGAAKMATTSWVRAQDLYRTAGTSYRRSAQRIAQLEDRLR